ncbi:VCBS domain-containing protein [Rhodococcus sp. NPDC079359]|uniref:VCBS domain-containing protein n=1 Tax=Rhodococcus sp. NPDC079359 TaxID=3154961 RepID=UPI0034501F01
MLDITGGGPNAQDGGQLDGPPIEALWLAARDLQARTSAYRTAGRATGSASTDATDVSGDGYSFIVDPLTGAVTGTVDVVTSEGVVPVYVATNAPDPSVGNFVLDSATGVWSFTPSDLLRRLAVTSDEDDVIGVHVLVGIGDSVTHVDLAVPVLPLALAPTSEHTVEASNGTVHGMIRIPGGAVGEPFFFAVNAPDAALGSFALDSYTGAWTFTPTTVLRNLAAQSAGDDAFDLTFLVGDGLEVASVTVAVPIAPPVNGAPTVVPDAASTTVDPVTGTVLGQVVATDPENDPIVFVASDAPDPAMGIFTLDSATGRWTFTPSSILRDLATLSPGDDSFGVTILVGDGTSVRSVVISVPVSPVFVDSAPVIGDVPFIATGNPTTGVVVGSVNFSSPGGGPLTYTVGGTFGPANGYLDLDSATGAFVYTPSLRALTDAWRSPSGTAPVSFTVTATTSSGLTATTTVSVPIGVSSDALLELLRQFESHPSAVAVGNDGAVYVVNSGAGRLSVIDPITQTVSAVVAVGKTPTAVAVDAENRVWVTNSGDGTVTVVSNGYVIKTIRVDSGPAGIVFASDGTAFVSNSVSSTVTVIDSTFSVRRTVAVGKNPTGIAVDADDLVYVANFGDGTISVIDMDNLIAGEYPWDNAKATDTIALTGVNPYRIAIGSDGALYVTDPTHDTVTRLARSSEQASRANQSVSHDSSTSWSLQGAPQTVTSQVGTVPYLLETYVVPGSPTSIASGLDGTIYVANGSGNTITEISWNVGTRYITVGAGPTGISVEPGGTLYVSNGSSNTLSVLGGTAPVQIPIGLDTYRATMGSSGQLILTNTINNGTRIIQANPNIGVGQNASAHFSGLSRSIVLAVGPDGRIFTDSQAYLGYGGYIYGFNDAGNIVSSGMTMYGLLLNNDTSARHAVMEIAPDGTYYLLTSGLLYIGHDAPEDPLSSTRGIAFERIVPEIFAEDLVVGTDNRLYLTSGSGTITVLDRTDMSVMTVISVPVGDTWDARLNNFTLGLDGKLYATTNYGTVLHIIDTADYSVRTVVPTAGVSSVAAGTDGRIYLGTYGGVSVLNANLDQVAFVKIGEETPVKVVIGTDGRVYIVGATVYVLDPGSYSIGTVALSSSNSNSVYPRDAVAGGGGIYILSASCGPSYCTTQFNQVGLSGSLSENGIGVQQMLARLANIADLAYAATIAPADAIHDALDGTSAGTVADLAGIAENIQAIKSLGTQGGLPILGLVTILDKVADLKDRLPGIAAGDMKDYLLGLADVAAIAIALAPLAVSAPAGISFLAFAGLTITVLEAVLNLVP